MWLSELVGRLSQQLKENGDMPVKTKIKGFHSSNFDDNFIDVDSRSFTVLECGVREDSERKTVLYKHLQINL